MKRRDILKAAAAAGLYGVLPGSSGCVTPDGVFRYSNRLETPDMDEFLAQYDQSMANLKRHEVVTGLLPLETRHAFTEGAPELDRISRATRVLYTTGALHDLPLEAQLHPGMQERLRAYAPEMESTVNQIIDMIRDMPEDKRKEVQRVLVANPELPTEMGKGIQRLASRSGMREHRRDQVLEGMRINGWRLRKQPPSLLFDEYMEKVDRVAPRGMSQAALERRIASLVGSKAMLRARMAAMASSSAPGASNALNQPTSAPATPKAKKKGYFGLKIMGFGGILFGAGLVVIGLGAAIDSESVLGAGAIMTIVGLPIVLLGLIVLAIEAIARA